MNRTMNLNILNTMYYKRSTLSLDDIISNLAKQSAGFDALTSFDIIRNDEIVDFTNEETAIHLTPPSLDPDQSIEDAICLKEGKYRFMQLPVLDTKQIKLQLLPFIGNTLNGKVYIRIFKESILEEVMQFLLPLKK